MSRSSTGTEVHQNQLGFADINAKFCLNCEFSSLKTITLLAFYNRIVVLYFPSWKNMKLFLAGIKEKYLDQQFSSNQYKICYLQTAKYSKYREMTSLLGLGE